jgi:hypothetical protein
MHVANLALFIFVVIFSQVHAASLEIPCEDSPKAAQLNVPSPANKYLHVVCSKYGHILHPTKGWFWTQPGGFSPVYYPAQMVRSEPEESGNTIYFENIEVTDLDSDVTASRWKEMGMMFDPNDSTPQKSMEIVAITNAGSLHKIYVFEGGWGWSCSPNCENKTVFLMISKPKQEVVW